MTPVTFLESMDHVFHISSAPLLAAVPACREHPSGGLGAVLPLVLSTLRRGLGDRVLLLDTQRDADPVWAPCEPPPADPATVTLGVRLNPERLTSIVDKGPDAESAGPAAEFRAFWRGRAGTRRFQDGSIREAVVWRAETLHEHRMLCRQVVQHLLQTHFEVSALRVREANVPAAVQRCRVG